MRYDKKYLIRVMASLCVVIFAIEFLIMAAILKVPVDAKLAFLDSSLLVAALGPAIWWATLRPLLKEMSARKKLEEEFRTIFEYSPFALLAVVDEDGLIQRVNPRVEEIFGYKPDELLCRSVDILVPERFRATHYEQRKKYMLAPTPRRLGIGRDLVGLRKDGTEVPVEIALTPMRINDKMLVLTTLTDISVRKNIEGQRDRALQAREELVAIVSHEIRNPLSTIMTGLHVIHKNLTTFESKKQLDPLMVQMLGAANQMNRITSDLLDVTKIEAGHLSLRPGPVETYTLVREVVESFRKNAEAKKIALKEEVSPNLQESQWDHDRIVQVLSNLVGNALKFTEAGGVITVSATASGDGTHFEVRDSGAGIPPEELGHVFERFWQAKHREYLGAGLGLYITKNIVAAHGGSIRVNSELGRGSTFIFDLPRKIPLRN